MPDKITQIKVGSSTYDIEPAASATLQVDNAAPTLAWGATSVVGTVDGVDLSIKMPANPVSYGGSAAALGSSSGGSATTVSRSDHVHALPALTSCSGTLTVAKGGTGATDAATARTNLGITLTNLGAAASSHPHGNITSSGTITSTAVDTASGVVVVDSNNKIQKVTDMSKVRSIIGAGTSSLALGTTATTAAKGNHSHTTSIATSSSTNELTLAHGTKYSLTAGGDSFVFTMPSDNNTSHSGIGICSTGASTAAKTVVFPNFTLVKDQTILIRVSTTNSATSGVTLNVNSTGAKSIYIGGSAWSTTNQLNAGDYLATYDGTYWKLTRIYLTDSTYTHPNSGVTAGTYKSVTVNATGHVTGGSNPTTLSGYGITDAAPLSHTTNTSNPHSVTKSQVGLGSVVNTGDSATPVSGGTTKFTTGGAYTELAKKAPTSHASTATTYGIGTSSNYGHVKLSDSTSSTSAATAGIAASPKAVKAAYDKAVEAYNLASSGSFTYGTEDLVAGASALTTGTLYFVYE